MTKRVAKIFLFNPENKLFLYQRDNKPRLEAAGYWDLIGGGIEKKETPCKALVREIKEELGEKIILKLKKIELVGNVILKKDELNPRPDELFLFRGNLDSELNEILQNTPYTKEGQKTGFFSLDELYHIRFPSTYLSFLLENKHLLKFS